MAKKIQLEKKTRPRWLLGIYFFISMIIIVIFFIYTLLWSMSFTHYRAEWGISFSKEYADFLGLNWKETYEAILDELSPQHIRIAANWNVIEEDRGQYEFNDTDWMLFQAAKRNVRVTLVIGQKTPRWPECHIPEWAKGKAEESRAAYWSFVSQVVRRYQSHPALDTWQVENEPFIHFDFGDCAQYQSSIIYDELDIVRAEDGHHPIMITDSGELSLWRKATQIGDVFGTTIYRVVRMPTGHRFSYAWLPPGFYKFRAYLLGLPYEKFYISELQAEPWFHEGDPTNTPVVEMEKTMNPSKLKKNIDYAKRVGASRIYLWGSEWWYYMKTVRGEGEYWNIVQEEFQK